MNTIGRQWGLFLLALGLAVVAAQGPVSGAPNKNCETQQCVQLATNNGQKGNNVWIYGSIANAYSVSFARVGYGQDSIGGTPATEVMGFYRSASAWTADCPDLLPVTGQGSAYNSGTTNTDFMTVCQKSD